MNLQQQLWEVVEREQFWGVLHMFHLPAEVLKHPDVVKANAIMQDALVKANALIEGPMKAAYPGWKSNPPERLEFLPK